MVTAARGQLGSRLAAALPAGTSVCLTHADLDITSAEAVNNVIANHRPDVVINAAAFTAVDAAESDERSAMAVNRDGPANIARSLARYGGQLVHVSTDYVFAGDATRPYEIDDPIGPQTAYGRSKAAGEQIVREVLPHRSTIVRTAWLYGGPGRNFVDTMITLEREKDTVSVVADQIGSPTYAADLAAALIELTNNAKSWGLLHYVNAGQASWFEFACEVFRLRGANPARVLPITTEHVPRPAARPAWSVLSTRRWVDAGFAAPRDWRDALASYLQRAGVAQGR